MGSEVKQEQISVFLEYENLKSFNGLTLTNSLLVREFPTQINKVNLKTQSGSIQWFTQIS